MARIYLDEQMDTGITEILVGYGHDAIHTYDVGNRGASDSQQLLFASNAERVLVTLNREDFEELHRWWLALYTWGIMGRHHSGILTTWGDIPTVEWARLIDGFFQHSQDMTNRMMRYNRQLQRWRPYPSPFPLNRPQHHLHYSLFQGQGQLAGQV